MIPAYTEDPAGALFDLADWLAEHGHITKSMICRDGALALRRSTTTLDELCAEAIEDERLVSAVPVQRPKLRVIEGGRV